MSSKFHDQASYIAAFLAVSVGLMIFRSDIQGININFGFINTSLFWLLVGFVLLLVFATYLSALAVMSEQLNITKIPLTKYIQNVASFFTAVGLLLPIAALIIYLVIAGMTYLSVNNQDLLNMISLAISLFALGVTAGRYATLRNKRQIEHNYSLAGRYIEQFDKEFKNILIEERFHPAKNKDSTYEFLEHYEYVTNYTKEYLRSLGYGVRGNSISFIAKLLLSKEIISNDLSRELFFVGELRNKTAHAITKPTKKEVERARRTLDDLFKIIQPLFIDLVEPPRSLVKN